MNKAYHAIKFEMERPAANNSISLLDFKIQIREDGMVNHQFYQKKAKTKLIPHFRMAMPSNTKRSILRNEVIRRKERCSSPSKTAIYIREFKETMRINGYPTDFLYHKCHSCIQDPAPTRQWNHNTTESRNFPSVSHNDFIYFEFPFINDWIDSKVRRIFKELDISVRLYRTIMYTQECTMKQAVG